MMFVEPPGVISDGKLAAVIIFTLIAGIIIGIFIGFLIWRAQVISLPLTFLEQATTRLLGGITV